MLLEFYEAAQLNTTDISTFFDMAINWNSPKLSELRCHERRTNLQISFVNHQLVRGISASHTGSGQQNNGVAWLLAACLKFPKTSQQEPTHFVHANAFPPALAWTREESQNVNVIWFPAFFCRLLA